MSRHLRSFPYNTLQKTKVCMWFDFRLKKDWKASVLLRGGNHKSYPIWKLASSHLQWAVFLLQLLQRVGELLPSFLFQSGACKREGCSDYVPTWSQPAGQAWQRWGGAHADTEVSRQTWRRTLRKVSRRTMLSIISSSLAPEAVVTSPSYKVLTKAVIQLWGGKGTSWASGMQRGGLVPYFTQNEEKQLSEGLLTGAGYHQPFWGKLVFYWPFWTPIILSYSLTDSTVRIFWRGGGVAQGMKQVPDCPHFSQVDQSDKQQHNNSPTCSRVQHYCY